MPRPLTAALLSGLLFPGAGQIYLKRRLRGWLIVLVVLVAVCYFATQVLTPVLTLMGEALDGTLAPDPVAISERLQREGNADNPLNTLAVAVIVIGWIGSVIDAYLLGRRSP